MVNRGKPSRDCFPCRKRKLRCDLRADCCGQCQRAKLLCHGFRDPKELAFCDETHATRRKVLARQVLRHTPAPRTLQLGWTTRSRQAFFALYVAGLSRSHDTLEDLYICTSPDDTLSASIDAASLAFMCNELNSLEILSLARQQYRTALHHLGQTLQKPQLLAQDATLQSVLLLDVYEKMVHPDPRASESWMSHILGALSLIIARGNGNNLGPIAQKLTMRVVTTLSISCGAAQTPILGELMSLRDNCSFVASDARFDFTSILVDVVSLRHMSACATDNVERAKKIDEELAHIESTMYRSKDVLRICITKDHPHVFEHHYDNYLNHFTAQIWNGIRMIRLELNNIIRTHDFDHNSANRIRASQIIDMITRQICAAVPQLILPEARSNNEVPFTPLQRLQCRTMLAPLYIAYQTSDQSRMRNWIKGIMEHMAEAGSMKVAKDVLDVLETNPETNYWTIYALTGCYALAA